MNFDQFNLDSRLNAGINKAGYETPTPIQESAIPMAMKGHDIIGTAQTGTGKTAAFVLPILHKLLSKQSNGTRALVITPTRELAEQIHDTFNSLSVGTNLRSVSIYGGVGAQPQIKALKKGVEIVVACPGRLLDHLQNNGAKLDKVEVLVLDEADQMLDMGFLPDIKRILKFLPQQRQTMLFSATFPEEIEKLGRQTLRNPQRVAIGIVAPAHTVEHTLYPVPAHLKRELLLKILEQTNTDSVLVFTRTKHRAKKLGRQIEAKGYSVTTLHGNRSQNQRQAALGGFKSGRYQIMIATDIAARGIDVEGISHVINFDMPNTADAYIHRIGRTGRAEHTGDAFTFITSEDDAMVRKIEKIMKQKLEQRKLDDFDYNAKKEVHPEEARSPRPHNSQRNSQRNRQRSNSRRK